MPPFWEVIALLNGMVDGDNLYYVPNLNFAYSICVCMDMQGKKEKLRGVKAMGLIGQERHQSTMFWNHCYIAWDFGKGGFFFLLLKLKSNFSLFKIMNL